MCVLFLFTALAFIVSSLLCPHFCVHNVTDDNHDQSNCHGNDPGHQLIRLPHQRLVAAVAPLIVIDIQMSHRRTKLHLAHSAGLRLGAGSILPFMTQCLTLRQGATGTSFRCNTVGCSPVMAQRFAFRNRTHLAHRCLCACGIQPFMSCRIAFSSLTHGTKFRLCAGCFLPLMAQRVAFCQLTCLASLGSGTSSIDPIMTQGFTFRFTASATCLGLCASCILPAVAQRLSILHLAALTSALFCAGSCDPAVS